MEADALRLSWAAGVWEAKGYLRDRGSKGIVARLTDTNRSLLESFADIVQDGSIYGPDLSGQFSKTPRFRFETSRGRRIVEVLDPYLTAEGRKRFSALLP